MFSENWNKMVSELVRHRLNKLWYDGYGSWKLISMGSKLIVLKLIFAQLDENVTMTWSISLNSDKRYHTNNVKKRTSK